MVAEDGRESVLRRAFAVRGGGSRWFRWALNDSAYVTVQATKAYRSRRR